LATWAKALSGTCTDILARTVADSPSFTAFKSHSDADSGIEWATAIIAAQAD
jgi:hypothetical protein